MSPLLPKGTAVGPYLIEEPIGAGAMGEVYRARDPRLERAVAVKVLATSEPDVNRLRRFEQEARAAAALTHPNILTIHDVGTHDGLPFLVLELLEGRTLRELLDDGPVPPERAVDLGLQLARGVGAAHAVKILHRDLKPENLFITRDGTLKILDFGLAKLKPRPLGGPDASTIADSMPGRMVGTLAYMAPEQLRAEPVDERADLFAIGALLFEMIVGRRPFEAKSAAETIAAVLREPPAALTGTSSPGLERVVLRCLEKDPADRFQSARDLLFALETALAAPAIETAEQEGTSEVRSIAVLPFTDMSPTRDQDYFCDGLAEELINALTGIEGLRIAARSSSFQYRGSAADIRAAGRQLGVATILEGSVRKAGDRLRVSVQLINVADGYQRWSERYDRKLEDVFAIQDEIAENVATSLRGVLSSQEKQALQRQKASVECYEYFLRGRQLVHRFSKPGVEGAMQMFERAIATDGSYAPAWAGLAECHAWLYEWWGGGKENLDEACRASSKALELAPELADTHGARGFALVLAGRHDEAVASFRQALKINPNHYDSLYYYARAAFAGGDIERSAELFARAAEARREDFQSPILLSQSLRMLGREEEAIEAVREGIRRVERHLELDPTDSRALSLGANALDHDGQHDRAMRWSSRALELYPNESGVMFNAACLRARHGMKEEAIEILEFALERGWGKRSWIENDPDYDNVRDDPRFEALLEKLK